MWKKNVLLCVVKEHCKILTLRDSSLEEKILAASQKEGRGTESSLNPYQEPSWDLCLTFLKSLLYILKAKVPSSQNNQSRPKNERFKVLPNYLMLLSVKLPMLKWMHVLNDFIHFP